MYDYLIYFLAFSFLGWCAEVAFYFFKTGRFVNRGLAKGPVCPIYGVGILLPYLLLGKIESFFVLALFSALIATAIELITGALTDKMLGVRLWDYSSEKGNIHGYICPRFSLIWGVVCAAAIKLIPLLDPVLRLARETRIIVLILLAFVIVFVDIENEVVKIIKGEKRLGKPQ